MVKKNEHYWDKSKRDLGLKSFNDVIGLPTRKGAPQQLHDYQHMIEKALLIPSYLNSKLSTKVPVSHHLFEKKASEREKENKYLHGFKLKHIWIKKATGLGIRVYA
jgi:hypothetical protein